jgi:hypothetical protein
MKSWRNGKTSFFILAKFQTQQKVLELEVLMLMFVCRFATYLVDLPTEVASKGMARDAIGVGRKA